MVLSGHLQCWERHLLAVQNQPAPSHPGTRQIANLTDLYYAPRGYLAAATDGGLVLLVLFFQRHIIQGLTQGTMKE